VICCSDLASDPRWPALQPHVPDAGVRAVLGVPVHLAGTAVGSLNLYEDQPKEWPPAEVDRLAVYAGLIADLLAGALQSAQRDELARGLEGALDNRVTIERAVGLLMGRHAIDAVSAFNRLRRASRDSGRQVVEVAAALLAEGPL
jgi:GAF domain-containing protein